MARLNHSELKALSGALLELYAPGPYTDLPARLIALVQRHFCCDNYCWNEFTGHTALRVVHEPAFSGTLEVLNHYIEQHPLATALLKDRIQSSVKISDFTTLSQWQRSDLYNNFFRLEGLNHQLTFLGSARHYRVGIALNRSKRDFSEAERSMLDLLGPHIAEAYQTSRLFSYLSDAAESNGQAWLIADSSGRILFETGKAVDWLTEYFGQNGSLPPQLRDWLKRRAQSLVNSNCLNLTPKEFSIQRGAKRLNIQSLSPVHASEHRLVLSETSEELDVRSLQTFGLTKREAEVLLWISQGKRNGEIAEILGARSRTIGKHVERILAKLCVETRTAAANMASELLHSPPLGNGSSA
jgi:DNA-binding CsgD family transcriptional regulator